MYIATMGFTVCAKCDTLCPNQPEVVLHVDFVTLKSQYQLDSSVYFHEKKIETLRKYDSLHCHSLLFNYTYREGGRKRETQTDRERVTD